MNALISSFKSVKCWNTITIALAGAAVLQGFDLHAQGRVSSLQPAGTVFFQTQDLPDVVSGQDLWGYNYTITGFSFEANHGFSIFFDHGLFAGLQSPPPSVNADWSVLAVQPDTILRQPGFYDGQALRSGPSLADPFTVSFVWKGAGTPGSQPFVLYNSDFSERFAGTTVPVPEPHFGLLMGIGLALFAAAKTLMRKDPSEKKN